MFHTEVLHATSEVVTTSVKAKEAHLDEIYAKSIVLTNGNGGMVKITVGQDGKIDIQETLCDVFVYPNECLVREYRYENEDVIANFAGLTPDQVLLNFIPFVSQESSEFNGQTCYLLCTVDGKNEYIGKTLLFNFPSDKVARRVVVLDANGAELKQHYIPYENNIRQLTINMPKFFNTDTQVMYQVDLPMPSPIWSGCCSNVCSSKVTPTSNSCISETGINIGDGIYEDADSSSKPNDIDPKGNYDVVHEDYAGNTYYNIALTKDFFTNNAKMQYLMVELMDRNPNTNPDGCTNRWSDDTLS